MTSMRNCMVAAAAVAAAWIASGCSERRDAVMDMAYPVDSVTAEAGIVDFEVVTEEAPVVVTQEWTRATALGASAMKDLWLYDYDAATGALLQRVHYGSGDAGWTSPQLSMLYGQHRVVAVAAAGTGAAADDAGIVWEKPHDTFAVAQDVVVSSASAAATLTLGRQVARVTLVIEDALPDGIGEVSITLGARSTGLLLPALTGTEAAETVSTADVSKSAGREGVSISVWSLCPSAVEWVSAMNVTARDTDGALLTSVDVSGVTLLRGRTTTVRGRLFRKAGAMSVSLDDAWLAGKEVTF